FTASYEMDGPTNVTAKPSSYKALKVTAKKSGDITGYNIRYRKGSGSWKTVTVKGNKNLSKTITGLTPGSYKVQVRTYCTVSGKNYYSAWSASKSVSCNLSTPTSVKVTNSSSKALKITAKKSGTITGYNIRYKKGSGSWKTVTVKGNKNLNKTIKGLKKGSTYKVQVRTYCTISGKNYPSSWSATKTVKIKK
ncbi:MAG: fibronectin type III domain-containing protein, partial [Lachnospiraceae bacterium]